ncbi:glycosyltransferase family 2 protein [Candidatus Methylopumilus planktonicus]|uniref:glycosyltransferase family 2 protein n=1 Tax=Candidatus Methylopumilus planktonicus TaxID=1581557 RepID=UPI00111CDBDC|nr:glycosyltransferase family 2 protein [Candidatus Methylopumilus planktonicus]QDD01766.1 glycosyltransferase family 2 protein [Candidatus Methylopumilus planktonicus]
MKIKIKKKNKLISIVTFCFNEQDNVVELYERIKNVMKNISYDYELIFIDNQSSDNTVSLIKNLIAKDKKVRLIVNARNFGHIRSPNYGILQSNGDACIAITSDLQDPPELIPELLQKWRDGFKVVLLVKKSSEENSIFYFLRKSYYKIINKLSDVPLIDNATGAGLFDKKIVSILKDINDPYPYLRGLLCEIGFPIGKVYYDQPRRKRGLSKNNFYTLYDHAVLGVVNHSKVPLRLMTIGGFALSFLSLFIALSFLFLKLFFWNSFQLGTAPILIGIFFFGAMQAFFIGILGEYIGSIYTHVRKLPLVFELERINFKK